MTSTEPVAERLPMPAGYGTTTTTLSWADVRERLKTAKQYWFVTNRPGGGSPHVVPLDGMWIDDAWYYGGSPQTAHRKHVHANPNVAMHLPDPWKVVVVEGVVRTVRPSPGFQQELVSAQHAKYPEYPADEALYAEVLALFPQRVRAWTAFPDDCTRFVFPE